MSGRILVADDEKELRDLIARFLRNELFEVHTVHDGETALEFVRHTSYDLIILDIMMPGIDGYETLASMKKIGTDAPVLFLTARDDDPSIIAGLGLGAVEYMTKPFSPAVLTARVKAIMRLKAGNHPCRAENENTAAGKFTLDASKCSIGRNGIPIRLSAMEYRILKYFLEHPGQVFTRDQLYAACWEEAFHDDNTIVVYVRRLREKIEDDPGEPRHLLTMRGLGYYFSPDGEKR